MTRHAHLFRDADESFRYGGKPIALKLVDYWRWSGSRLLENVQRGVLAEFLVASALDLTDDARVEWGAYDLEYPCDNGGRGIRIEVKSAAYIQSWHQERDSRISFGIAPSKESWDPRTNCTESFSRPARTADIYVFCHFTPRLDQRDEADPLDVGQWDFYVLATGVLDRERPDGLTIGLEPLREMAGKPTPYQDLRGKLERIAAGLHDPHGEEVESPLGALGRVQASVSSRGVDLAGWEHDVKTERQAAVGSPASGP